MKRASGSELRAFLGAFSPEIARIALRLRRLVLDDAPGASEFIDDADGVVAMAYGLTEQPADAFCQIAVRAGWVELGFRARLGAAARQGARPGQGTLEPAPAHDGAGRPAAARRRPDAARRAQADAAARANGQEAGVKRRTRRDPAGAVAESYRAL